MIPESKAADSEQRKSEDIQKMIGLSMNICHVGISYMDINRAGRLGKVVEDKDRPLLVMLKEEDKKREIFQNMSKIREPPSTKSLLLMIWPKKQKEELKNMVEQAQKKGRDDESGEYMYQVRVPPWSWYIKKISKGNQPM